MSNENQEQLEQVSVYDILQSNAVVVSDDEVAAYGLGVVSDKVADPESPLESNRPECDGNS